MKGRIAFLTMDSLDGYVSDDSFAVKEFQTLGWSVEMISWTRAGIDWRDFDAAIVRSTWDYHKSPHRFLDAMKLISDSGCKLANPYPWIHWNLRKTYLFELEKEGIRILPTRLATVGGEISDFWFRELGADRIVIKPVVGANAENTWRVNVDQIENDKKEIDFFLGNNSALIQTYAPAIEREGEYSLFYFNGVVSHAIQKIPKKDDFRVQEEHGGDIQLILPEKDLIDAGEKVMSVLESESFQRPHRGLLLFTRVDFVRDKEGAFCVMEVELIEPSLYLRMHPQAPARFAEAVQRWLGVGPDC